MTQNRTQAIALFLFVFASSCAGCVGCKSPVDSNGSDLPSACQTVSPLIQPQKLDVLFMIDNSTSMQEEQDAVASELTTFIDELKQGGGVATDFHVGVITSSVYQHTNAGMNFDKRYPSQSGALQPVPPGLPDGGVVLGSPDAGERILDGLDPDLVEKFSRLVQQGTQGSGQETPFEAIRLAVTDLDKVSLELGGNASFLRDRARLLVVVVSDEDDCSERVQADPWHSIVTVSNDPLVDDCANGINSLTPVAEYYGIFSGLKDSAGQSRDVIWTEIAPVSTVNKAAMAVVLGGQVRNIDCPTSNAPGTRHRAMAEMFDPSLVNLDSICRKSFHDTLRNIAQLASVSQTLEITNVPDPRMLQIAITRKDGTTVQVCTLQSGLARFEPPIGNLLGRVVFGPTCLRRSDDTKVEVKMLCVN